jgi:AcrR family transcriptional regulator
VAVARGRHAPPVEVRRRVQRERLLRAAALEFAQRGDRGASSDTVSRRAAMSKATFYEHFADKEDCMLALYDYGVGLILGLLADGPAP